MLDPNTALFAKWQALHESGDFAGANRPVGRVTIVEPQLRKHRSSSRPGIWRSALFDPDKPENDAREVPIFTISISRSIGQDSATCNITLPNVRPGRFHYRIQGTDEDPFGAGFLSPDRGYGPKSQPTSVFADGETWWNYEVNAASEIILPNSLIRTYQGYGSDNLDENGIPYYKTDPEYVHPSEDGQLVLTGVWLVDRVTLSGGVDNPMISLECRDLAKLLMEQFIYPKMIPMSRFPLVYEPMPDVDEEGTAGKNVAKYLTSSPEQHSYYANGVVYGHRGEHAFDGREETYWLSHSYPESGGDYSFEWIEADCDGEQINEVYIETVKDGYKVFVSVKEDGEWKGSGNIPYSSAGRPHSHEADIPFVEKSVVGSSNVVKIKLPRTYEAQKIRITFTDLQQFPDFDQYPYRVGVRTLKAYKRTSQTESSPTTGDPGKIGEWSDAIKELCAWAGFTNPDASPAGPDPILGRNDETGKPMRVWGDFEILGVGPKVATPADYFMNKSFMEGIRQIVDFIGGIFYIDHTGGAQFRMPNIWSGGNFICDSDSVTMAARINTHPIELNDGVNLMEYSMTLDDSQVRSEIVVVGKDPDVNGNNMVAGGYVLGEGSAIDFSDLLNGQTRLMMVPGEATKGFATNIECQRMAELLALQILFTYRRGSAKIPAHPGLQIDDQVRIFERVTSENTIHYVSGIESNMDLTSGEYTMTLSTHWLGRDPNTDWLLDKYKLTPGVARLPAILKRLGDYGGGGEVA